MAERSPNQIRASKINWILLRVTGNKNIPSKIEELRDLIPPGDFYELQNIAESYRVISAEFEAAIRTLNDEMKRNG